MSIPQITRGFCLVDKSDNICVLNHQLPVMLIQLRMVHLDLVFLNLHVANTPVANGQYFSNVK